MIKNIFRNFKKSRAKMEKEESIITEEFKAQDLRFEQHRKEIRNWDKNTKLIRRR